MVDPVFLEPLLPPREDPAIAAILEGLCRATGGRSCELELRWQPHGPSARYSWGETGEESRQPLVIQAQPGSEYEACCEVFGAGDGPAASPRALEALGPMLEGALAAVIASWNAARQLDILAQIIGVSADAVLLIDGQNEIGYANAAGEKLLALHTQRPMARVLDGQRSAPLWDLITAEIATLRDGGHRSRHVSLVIGDGETWDVELVGLSGASGAGNTLVVMSPVRVPDAAEIHEKLGRYRVSRREAEVLVLVLRGMTAQRIADELAISEYTVKDHLKHAYAKLGISSRTQIIARLTNDGTLSL